MKFDFKKLLLPLVVAVIACIAVFSGIKLHSVKRQAETAVSIIKADGEGHALDSIKQLIVVYNDYPEETSATLVALENNGISWSVKFGPIKAHIGRDGFASPGMKREGDEKTPTGLFALKRMFSYDPDVKTGLSFTQTTSADKWVDDPESDCYNEHVRGDTDARSFEKLLLGSDAYKYCVVIEYNTDPVVKGMGSAIFFHLGDGPTAGCVDISERMMKKILKWLSVDRNPHILMGSKTILLTGEEN